MRHAQASSAALLEENRRLEERIRNKKLVAYCKEGIPPHLDHARTCNYLFKKIVNDDKSLSAFLGRFETLKGKRFLDIGAGSGYEAIDLTQEGASVVAFEYSADRVTFNRELMAEKGMRHAIVRGDAGALPFRNRRFDLINCRHLIEHLRAPGERLREFTDLLAEGGALYINFPNKFSLRQIAADDHYKLPLVVLLPRPLAKFIVTKLFRYEKVYSTNVFLSKWAFEKMAADARCTVRYLIPDIDLLSGKLRRPSAVKSPLLRLFLLAAGKTGLTGVLSALLASSLVQSLLFPQLHGSGAEGRGVFFAPGGEANPMTMVLLHSVADQANRYAVTGRQLAQLYRQQGRHLVTFDDGYERIFSHLLSLPRDKAGKTVVFLVAEKIGGINDWDAEGPLRGQPLLSKEQIALLAGHGVRFGSHSNTHPDLRKLPAAEMAEEIAGSKKRLEDLLGSAVEGFAYPYGQFDKSVIACVKNAGYRWAATTSPRFGEGRGNPFRLRRIEIKGNDSRTTITVKLHHIYGCRAFVDLPVLLFEKFLRPRRRDRE